MFSFLYSASSHTFSKPRCIPHILMRRYAMTLTAYKFLDIGIVVGSSQLSIWRRKEFCTITMIHRHTPVYHRYFIVRFPRVPCIPLPRGDEASYVFISSVIIFLFPPMAGRFTSGQFSGLSRTTFLSGSSSTFICIVHRWPLLSPILRAAYESRVEKTDHPLRRSTNRYNFLLFHKTGSAGQPGRVPLIETSDSQKEQHLENTAGGVGLPISTFPSIS
ncbi:hypothetical protein ALC57_05249 [Trachymyrmex cornetzi]|uniref:Uncharacterized protein n=1 Tax=Trachymyrmex cornetzi TaxID=471704 RepID=A0A151JB62_9HYME|nr:hypothetical protein ALC57_05249 [Trachymyrmex cornetzi]